MVFFQYKYYSFLIVVIMLIFVYPPHRVSHSCFLEQILSTPSSLSVLYSSFLYSLTLLFMLVGRGGERQSHSCQLLSVGSEEGVRENLSGRRWRSIRNGEICKNEGGMEEDCVYKIHSLTHKRTITYTPIWLFLLFWWQREVSGCDINVRACMVQFCLPCSDASHIFILFLIFQHIVFGWWICCQSFPYSCISLRRTKYRPVIFVYFKLF